MAVRMVTIIIGVIGCALLMAIELSGGGGGVEARSLKKPKESTRYAIKPITPKKNSTGKMRLGTLTNSTDEKKKKHQKKRKNKRKTKEKKQHKNQKQPMHNDDGGIEEFGALQGESLSGSNGYQDSNTGLLSTTTNTDAALLPSSPSSYSTMPQQQYNPSAASINGGYTATFGAASGNTSPSSYGSAYYNNYAHNAANVRQPNYYQPQQQMGGSGNTTYAPSASASWGSTPTTSASSGGGLITFTLTQREFDQLAKTFRDELASLTNAVAPSEVSKRNAINAALTRLLASAGNRELSITTTDRDALLVLIHEHSKRAHEKTLKVGNMDTQAEVNERILLTNLSAVLSNAPVRPMGEVAALAVPSSMRTGGGGFGISSSTFSPMPSMSRGTSVGYGSLWHHTPNANTPTPVYH